MMRTKRFPPLLAGLAALMLCAGAQAQAQWTCGPMQIGFGPYDYRPDRLRNAQGIEAKDGSQHKAILSMVEGAHFKPEIEALLHGKTRDSTPGGDIAYTLHAIPNHHRALIATVRYGAKLKTDHPRDMRFSVPCYFERAVRFAPDDPIVRMLYAQYLKDKDRQAEALGHLDVAVGLAADSAFTHYNIGLVYLEVGAPDKALQQAHRARALGFPRTELEQKLREAGKWQDPEPASAAASDAAAAATSGASAAGTR